jgi:hypothetical protein
VDGEVGPIEFFFRVQAQANTGLQGAINRHATQQGDGNSRQGADQLRGETHATEAPQGLQAEYAGGNAAPSPAKPMQGPDTEHVIDLPFVLRDGEHEHEQRARDATGDQRPKRMHQIGTGTHRDQAGESGRYG